MTLWALRNAEGSLWGRAVLLAAFLIGSEAPGSSEGPVELLIKVMGAGAALLVRVLVWSKGYARRSAKAEMLGWEQVPAGRKTPCFNSSQQAAVRL